MLKGLLPNTTSRPNRRLANNAAAVIKRYFSKGALAGGFTKEGLQQFGKRLWNEKQDDRDRNPYSDLFYDKISVPCSTWLDSHNDPSAEIAKAFFSSRRFYPERMLMTPFLYDKMHVPEFREGDKFLAWEVISKSPLELICSWNLGKVQGLTTVAFDPKLRRLYHGNCIDFDTADSRVFQALLPLHCHYAKFLLGGMKDVLEKKAIEEDE